MSRSSGGSDDKCSPADRQTHVPLPRAAGL